jgi:hypothetical protein
MPVKSDVKQRLFSYSETSKILNRSEVSLWRDVKEGRLVAVKIGGSARITGESIDRLCAGECNAVKVVPGLRQPHHFRDGRKAITDPGAKANP